MTRRPRLDDRTADALFSGQHHAGREDLADVAAFADRLRAAASDVPTPAPNTALAAVLTDGLSTDKGDLPATAGSNATAPAPQGSGLPNWRRTKRMLELLIAKVAGISLLAKTGVAAAAVVAGTTGAGLTGALPDQAQAAFDRALGEVPAEQTGDEADLTSQEVEEIQVVDEPQEAEETDGTEETEDTDGADEAEESDGTEEAEEDARPEVPGDEGRATADEHAGENGAAGRATADEAATDGRAYGERKADEGRERAPTDGQETRQDAATPDRDRAETAPSDGSGTADERPEAPEAEQTEERAAGSSESRDDAAGSAADRAPAGGRP